MPDIDDLRDVALAAIAAAKDLDALEQARVTFLGRKGELAAIQKTMGSLDDAGRRELGAKINAFKDEVGAALADRQAALEDAALAARFEAERLDLSLPPRRVPPGRPHILTQVLHEIVDVFVGMGYRVAEGPEVESGVFNFDLLNIDADHPARQEMDTIYISADDDIVLRTHTSPVQARVMLSQPVPIAVCVPGRVYRNDTVDATHSPVFTQVEGLVVDRGITMADLRGTLLAFAQGLFGPDVDVRLRPSMFPFTEPSAEVDVSCTFCAGDGSACRVCKGTGWIEILGAGMVDPNVLEFCGHDPDEVSGFAFGIGVERVAMLRHDIADIRHLFEDDVRFLHAF